MGSRRNSAAAGAVGAKIAEGVGRRKQSKQWKPRKH